jgi:AraC-like DNA-binding protein
LATFTSILEIAARRGNSALGLELGKVFRPEALGPLARLFATASTVGDALRKFNRYFPVLQTGTRSTLTISGGTARFAYSVTDPSVRFRAQDANLTLSIEHAMLMKLLGPRARLTCVEFEHNGDEDIALYQAHFGCPVRFGRRENAICFPAHYLEIPVADADALVNARIETELANSVRDIEIKLDLVAAIEAWIMANFCASSSIDIEYAASDFGMSLRSFQRKLAEHHINYLDLRNRVRRQIGQCMLAETTMPITAIALYLGYSETSAFSRGFKQQTGLSPAEYRNSQRSFRGDGFA